MTHKDFFSCFHGNPPPTTLFRTQKHIFVDGGENCIFMNESFLRTGVKVNLLWDLRQRKLAVDGVSSMEKRIKLTVPVLLLFSG